MGYRVGIDIGGTFTDFVVVDGGGHVAQWKEDSTPGDPLMAIEKGLRAIAAQRDLSLDEFVGSIDGFVHGSTIATNALITRQGGPVGLICTRGFRDVLYFRDGFKWERWNIHLEHPKDLVDRHLRIGVTERIGFDGKVLAPLEESDVVEAADRFRAAGVRAIAIALLWSVANPAHEQRVAELIGEQLPGVYVLKSSDVLPETREWQRTSATVLSAYVLPGIGDYLSRFEAMLEQNGLAHPANYMQINGGTASVEEIMRRPVVLVHSGPAAAPAAARHAVAGIDGDDSAAPDNDHLITVDMGGTSFDVCLIREGKAEMSRATQVEHQPVGVQAIEVASIGAGGGSIGWVDAGGALRVGPRSAGSVPGPVCYDAGGSEPTVTDANVILGYLSPEAFLGGRRRLREDLALEAVKERLADPLGLDPIRAAAGVVEVVNANMVGGIRSVSVERGIDPRGYLLVSCGGAGALHSARLARQLGMSRVLFPTEASTFCALGMIVTDVQHDYSVSIHGTSSDLDLGSVTAAFAEMEKTARERMEEDGFPAERIDFRRSVDARYKAQVWEITVPIDSKPAYDPTDVPTFAENFHNGHERQFTYALREQEIEFLHWRLTAVGLVPGWPAASPELSSEPIATPVGERDAYFPEAAAQIPVPVYRIGDVPLGADIVGPAIFESDSTTMVINSDDRLRVLKDGNLLVDVSED